MKEVETTAKRDSYLAPNGWIHHPERTFKTRIHDVTVGLMRLYEDADNVDSIPKAEGKVSVRPYVRGKPRKRSRPEPNPPENALQSDSGAIDPRIEEAIDNGAADPRLSELWNRLDHPDSVGPYFTPKPAGHSEAE